MIKTKMTNPGNTGKQSTLSIIGNSKGTPTKSRPNSAIHRIHKKCLHTPENLEITTMDLHGMK